MDLPGTWTDKTPDELLRSITECIKKTFVDGPEKPFDQIELPTEKKDWKKLLKPGVGGYLTDDGRFNQDESLLLLKDMYKVFRLSKYALSKFARVNRSLQSEINTLRETSQKTPDEGSSTNLQQMIKTELETFKTSLAEDLEKKMKVTKESTEKKWSDMFKASEQDLKNQKKEANKQRVELEKTMADSKRKDLVDNLERQKRASNICVTQVPESTESEKVRRDNEDRLTIIDLLKLNPDDVKHVFRAGAVQDKPRPLIAVMSSPDIASKLHGYGTGRPIRELEGENKKILYWVNQDFIKSDRIANYKARLAKPKRTEHEKAPAVHQDLHKA